MRTSRLAAAAGLVLLPLALAACTKPNPGATVFSGTSSVHREAACWSADGALEASQCSQDLIAKASAGDTVGTLRVVPGSTVGISVDPVVADAGWYPVIGNQRLVQEPIRETYYRFTYPDLQSIPADGAALQIIAGTDQAQGIWLFSLVK